MGGGEDKEDLDVIFLLIIWYSLYFWRLDVRCGMGSNGADCWFCV